MEATHPEKEGKVAAIDYGAQDEYATGIKPYQPVPTSGKAIASLVCGILGLCSINIVFGPIAICLAMQAKRNIRESNGMVKGDGLAVAGLVTGIISTVFGVISVLLMILVLTGAALGSNVDVNVSFDDDFFDNAVNESGFGN